MFGRPSLFIVAILLMVPSAVLAQAPYGQFDHGYQEPGIAANAYQAPTWQQLDSINTRLEMLEAENRRLQQMVAESAARSSAGTDSPEQVERVGYFNENAHVYGASTGAGVCPDCGKEACAGMPHLCGFCLEKSSWNKAGGWKIVPFGRLRGEFIYSSAPYVNDAIIAFLAPDVPGIDEDTYSIHGKQTQINFAITGPDWGEWKTGGVIATNFMGSQPLRNFSGVNAILGYAEVKNDEWRFSFGRMLDLFGPITPSTVNQLQQRGAGNIGIYRGAFNVDRYITVSEVQRWTLSGRVSQQSISDYQGIPSVRGKDNGWPNLEGRLGLELGCLNDYGRPFEIGISGVIGEVQAVADPLIELDPDLIYYPGTDEIEQTRGVCLDLQLRGPKFGTRGEVWWGKAAGTYFVATLQSLNPENAQAVESVGGWGEVYYKITPTLTTNVGYGIDDPRNSDLGFVNPMDPNAVGQISYNDVAWWNVIWNVTSFMDVEFEISQRQTHYLAAGAGNQGTLFHFASSLKF